MLEPYSKINRLVDEWTSLYRTSSGLDLAGTKRLAAQIHDSDDRDYFFGKVAIACSTENDLDLAMAANSQIHFTYERVQNLSEIGKLILTSGNLASAIDVAIRQSNIANEMEDHWQKADTYRRAAWLCITAKQPYLARKFWCQAIKTAQQGEEVDHPQYRCDSASVLADIAADIFHLYDPNWAASVVASIKNDGARHRVVSQLGIHPDVGRVNSDDVTT